MIKSTVLLPFLAVITSVLVACASGFSASFDSDPQHDFGSYRTYAWISDHPVEAILSGFPPR